MDNDIEVTPSHENKVQLFLRDNLMSIRHDDQKVYDLDVEFSKTRKNRDIFVVGVIALVVVLVALVSWFVTSRINESSRNVAVDIAVFEDLNLKNALDLAKKAETTLDNVTQEKVDAKTDYDSSLSTLRLQRQSDLDILSAKRMSDAERAQQKQAIVANYATQEKKLAADYKARAADIDARIVEAQKQVQSFDTKRVEEAKAQKRLLDNQQDLYEIEKKKMKETYEKEIAELRSKNIEIQQENVRLKTDEVKQLIDEYQAKISALDPKFADSVSDAFIERTEAFSTPGLPFRAAPAKIPANYSFTKADFDSVRDGYTGLDHLLSKVASIPFNNEAAPYVATARKVALLTGDAEERMLKEAFTAVETEHKARTDVEASLAARKADLEASKKALEEAKQNLSAAQASLEETTARYTAIEKVFSDAAAANGFDGVITALPTSSSPQVFLPAEIAENVASSGSALLYVYRAPKTFVGTLKYAKTDDGYSASVDKLGFMKELQVFDFVSAQKK